MDERHAKALASLVMGEAVHTGGNHWVVLVEREDGRWAAFSGDCGAIGPDRETTLNGVGDAVEWVEFTTASS